MHIFALQCAFLVLSWLSLTLQKAECQFFIVLAGFDQIKMQDFFRSWAGCYLIFLPKSPVILAEICHGQCGFLLTAAT